MLPARLFAYLYGDKAIESKHTKFTGIPRLDVEQFQNLGIRHIRKVKPGSTLPILTQKGWIPGMSARYTVACPPSPTVKMWEAAQVVGPNNLGCTKREAG